ncbi:polyprenyl synthetase family protein [Coprobacter tertius]|uniref:Polyprenyl synthetase family protein n=1 Tax=Coprobacter tertius TaxID=2944915 RepID=A0ABT1MD67_9BACT|nr:polyprenyl synthetase family protein [Coprobacter tertius]MCP9610580.1 polyprenyl synthetase family protein [Coprobacter tertius]
MDKLSIIQQPISDELVRLNEVIVDALKADSELMNVVVDYYLGKKGKQIRPILVMLSAKMCGGISKTTIDAAASIELLHNASLIHDDVVDESFERRGRRTVNGIWDNRIAVLVGDFFVSCALKHSLVTGNLQIVDTLSTLGKELAKGEIDQVSNVEEHRFSEEAYFEVIRQKTASLFISCMRMGALSAHASEERLKDLELFGEKLGLCFQIKDDIFDYFDNNEVGKPTGNDIREGKITLPLIYALNKATGIDKEKMDRLAKKDKHDRTDIEKLISFAKEMGGIEYAEDVMKKLRKEALCALSAFDESPVKESLKTILDYTIERDK